jgi:hypothetical protein
MRSNADHILESRNLPMGLELNARPSKAERSLCDSQMSSNSVPARQSFPPETERAKPPLTDEFCPLAVLLLPPVTVEPRPSAKFTNPPITEDHLALATLK